MNMRLTAKYPVAALAASLLIGAACANGSASQAWENHCVSCHGVDGKGKTRMGERLKIRDLTDAARQAEFSDEAAFNAIRHGLKDANGKTVMKPIEELTDGEINDLVAFVRTLPKAASEGGAR